jgi:hypothetical protein
MTHEVLYRRAHHPELYTVVRDETTMYTKLVAARSFRKGEIITPLENIERNKERRWTSVQIGKNSHIELTDELVFMNHSCNPSVIVDTTEMVVRAARNIEPGDEITFFYPSTEWEMASPFVCNCNQDNCLKVIAGAYHLPVSRLSKYFINKHICELIVDSLSQGRAPYSNSTLQ